MAEKIKFTWRRLPLWIRMLIVILACGLLLSPTTWLFRQTPVLTPETPPTAATNLSLQVSADVDDCEYTSSSVSYMVDSFRVGNFMGSKNGAVRFTDVTIPSGSTILSANLSLYCVDNGVYGDDETPIQIVGIKESNTGNFSTNPDSRPETTAYLNVSQVWTENQWYTFNVTDIVQEIINQDGWSSGNALGFKIKDNGAGTYHYVAFQDYYGNSSRAAKLDIEVLGEIDIEPPEYSNSGYTSERAGLYSKFYIKWTDANLSKCVFYHNNTGTWQSITVWENVYTTEKWANVTLQLNSTVGTVVSWYWKAWDANNNVNTTEVYSLTTKEKFEFDVFQVTESGDDATEYGDGTFSYTGTCIYVWSRTNTSSSEYRCGGLYFPNVTIPAYSEILSANLSVYVTYPQHEPNLKIYGCPTEGMTNFEDAPRIIDRQRTNNYIEWIGNISGGWYNKTGLEVILQELVDLGYTWTNTQAVSLQLIANTDQEKNFTIFSYDAGYVSKLYVKWRAPAPSYTDLGHNQTLGNQPVKFYVNVTDGIGLNAYIFSYSFGGKWHNETYAVEGEPKQLFIEIEKILPEYRTWIQYKFYLLNAHGKWTETETKRFWTTSSITYSNLGVTTNYGGQEATFHVFLNDTEHNLDSASFQWDYPEGKYTDWELIWDDLNSSSGWANITKTLPDDLGVKIWYRFKVTNTIGDVVYITGNLTIDWEEGRYPRYDIAKVGANTSRPNAICKFYSWWESPNNITGYIFSFNDGTGWENDTFVSIEPVNETWINVTKQLPNVHMRTTKWTVYVKDGSNNWEKLATQIHVVTDSHVVKVLNSTDIWAEYSARLSAQKKAFYWGGRYWVFAKYEENKFGLTSSTDGINWEEWYEIFDDTNSYEDEPYPIAFMDAYINETGFCHIVLADQDQLKVWYWAGQLYSNGTISLSEQQLLYQFSDDNYEISNVNDCYLMVDNDGFPWVTVLNRFVNQTYNYASRVENIVFKSSSKNGTWVMADGFPKVVDRRYYNFLWTYQKYPPLPWAIPIPVGEEMYFVVVWQHAKGEYAEVSEPLLLYYYNETTDEIEYIGQLSKYPTNQRVFAGFAAVPHNSTSFFYAYTTDDFNMRYGEWNNGSVYEVELWHDVWYEPAGWFVDLASPVLVYDNSTNQVFIFGASVHRINEIVYKKRNLETGYWSGEIVAANEKEVGMPKACSIVSGWFARERKIGLLYTTNPDNCTLRFFSIYTYPPQAVKIQTEQIDEDTYKFAVKWSADFNLDCALFYWNRTGTFELNGTYSFPSEVVEGWSNFTRDLPDSYGLTIAWYVEANDTYGYWGSTGTQYLQIIDYTELSVGWNNFTAWSVDVGHTLAEVNASLAIDNINWTVISLEYSNGTRAVLVWEQDTGEYIGQENAVVESGCTFYIYCKEAGEWYHNYP